MNILNISESRFMDEFKHFMVNSSSYNDMFTPDALRLLYNLYEDAEFEESIDFVEMCCAYAEYTPDGLIEDFATLIDPEEDRSREGTLKEIVDAMDVCYTLENGNYLITK